MHQAAFGRRDPHDAGHAAVRRHVFGQQRTHHEQHRRARDGERAVDVAARGGRGAGEIRVEHTVPDVHADLNRQVSVVDAVAFQPVGGGEPGRLDACQRLAGPPLGVRLEVAGGLAQHGPAVARRERAQVVRAALHRGALGREIGAARLRGPHVGEEEALHLGREEEWRHDHALGKDVARPRGHAPRLHAAHVRMVRPHHAVAAHRAVHLHRTDERDVREVRPAGVGIVQDEDLARRGGQCPHGGDGLVQRAQMHRNVGRLGDHLAGGVEQSRGAVASLPDVGRDRRMNQHQPHLLRDGGEGVPHHLEAHGVEAHVRARSTAPDACTVPHQPGSTSAVASRPARIAGP